MLKATQKELANFKSNTEVELPIVFHIIHENGNENIPEEAISATLVNLNEGFANTGYYNENIGVVSNISFCLAQQTPTGQATNGINRVQSPLTSVVMDRQDRELKDLARWNPNNYINIYVVNEICRTRGG